MEELEAIMQKFAASDWDLIAVPAQEWLDERADKDTLVSAIKQADKECGSCGCELDPLYKERWSFFNTIGGINMLSLEKVKNGLETFGYEYANNILCGHTKSKVKWVLPTGIVNVMAFEQATSYLFGFSDNGINLFPVHGDWDIADNLFIPWSEITSFKMKNGLLENEMILSTSAMKIEMKINKVVANNSWVKDNLNYLRSKNYFYHQ